VSSHHGRPATPQITEVDQRVSRRCRPHRPDLGRATHRVVEIVTDPPPRRRRSTRPARSPDADRVLIAMIMAATAVSVVLLASVTPQGRAPDEYRYFTDIVRLAQDHTFDSLTGHPPLYTAIAWVPYRLGGNDSQRYLLIRLLGALFAAGTVWATYRTSTDLFGNRMLARWVPPLVVALIPQFAFITGSVNSDGLLAMLAAFFCCLCVRALLRPPTWRIVLSLGAVSILGMLAKQRFVVLLPLLLIVLAVAVYRRYASRTADRSRRARAVAAVAGAVGIALVLLGLAQRFVPATGPLAALGRYVDWILPSMGLVPLFQGIADTAAAPHLISGLFTMFWGYFDWVALPLHPLVYGFYLALTGLSTAGIAVAAVRRATTAAGTRREGRTPLAVWVFLSSAIVLNLLSIVVYQMTLGGVQGRYFFLALVPIALFIGAGLDALVPERFSRPVFQGLAVSLVSIMVFETLFLVVPYYY
jgi:4-amino-4-deoxy-L-arabinose transferase-like glycosyltransferase